MPSEPQPEAVGKIVRHSLSVAGHRTSKEIANAQVQPLANLVAAINARRGGANLSSAMWVFVLNAPRRSS